MTALQLKKTEGCKPERPQSRLHSASRSPSRQIRNMPPHVLKAGARAPRYATGTVRRRSKLSRPRIVQSARESCRRVTATKPSRPPRKGGATNDSVSMEITRAQSPLHRRSSAQGAPALAMCTSPRSSMAKPAQMLRNPATSLALSPLLYF